ncbi:MAG: hypothetical protein M3507_02315 [Actinomycetota bacterium]|nr:hypothetical protein [Actinomycetota bacterium]
MASALATMLVAHQGGWDEAVFVAVPMVVLAGLLVLARRRAEREAADEANAVEAVDPASAGARASEASPE